MNIFGKSKQQSTQSQSTINKNMANMANTISVITNLKEQVDLLEKRNNFITKQKNNAILEAKQKLEKKDKNGAMLSLKKKKQFEDEIAKNQGIQLTLENQIYSLESANMQKAVIDALELGNKSIKQINNNLNPDKIDELMDDIQEQTDNSNAINQALSQNLQQVYDDTDLLEELEQLENSFLEKSRAKNNDNDMEFCETLPSIPEEDIPTIPIIPNISKKLTEDEEMELEMKQMVASMGI
jgi:charged multivesicular body protein 4